MWKSADVRRLLPFPRVRTAEVVVAVGVLLVVLLVGEIQGVIAGVIVSLLILVYRVSFPGTAELGMDPEIHRMVDIATHPGAERLSGAVVYRFDAPLIHSNAAAFTDAGLSYVEAGDELPRLVVIDCEVISHIDSTGVEAMVSLVATLRHHGIEVRLVRMHHEVQATLSRSGAMDEIGEASILRNPEDAVDFD